MTRLLLLVLVSLLLAGCTSSQPSPGTAPDPAPETAPSVSSSAPGSAAPSTAPKPPPAPRAGSCYRLSYDAALAPTTSHSPDPCGRQHTAETYYVGSLDTVLDGRLLTVDSEHVQRMLAEACPSRLPDFVAGTEEQRRLSMLRSVWFTPTVKQSDAGASWFRCDVVAVARDGELQPVTGSLRGVLATTAGEDRFGVCGTAEPGTAGFERVTCGAPHAWRAIRTVSLAGPDYPGVEAARAAGQEPCESAARAQAPDPLDFQWGYEWPTAEQWRSGRTYGLCWVPD